MPLADFCVFRPRRRPCEKPMPFDKTQPFKNLGFGSVTGSRGGRDLRSEDIELSMNEYSGPARNGSDDQTRKRKLVRRMNTTINRKGLIGALRFAIGAIAIAKPVISRDARATRKFSPRAALDRNQGQEIRILSERNHIEEE